MSNGERIITFKDENRGNYDLGNNKRTIQHKYYSN